MSASTSSSKHASSSTTHSASESKRAEIGLEPALRHDLRASSLTGPRWLTGRGPRPRSGGVGPRSRTLSNQWRPGALPGSGRHTGEIEGVDEEASGVGIRDRVPEPATLGRDQAEGCSGEAALGVLAQRAGREPGRWVHRHMESQVSPGVAGPERAAGREQEVEGAARSEDPAHFAEDSVEGIHQDESHRAEHRVDAGRDYGEFERVASEQGSGPVLGGSAQLTGDRSIPTQVPSTRRRVGPLPQARSRAISPPGDAAANQ